MKIISNHEKIYLLNWVYKNRKSFIKNRAGEFRNFLILQEANLDIPSLFFEIKKRILFYEGINDYILDPTFKDMVTFIEKGGFIHRHTDPTLEGYDHIRFNLFLSLPEFGGEPIYGENIIKVNEREYLKYNVNLIHHSSKKVLSHKPRITISYGILIKK